MAAGTWLVDGTYRYCWTSVWLYQTCVKHTLFYFLKTLIKLETFRSTIIFG
jgi:hypothetical protein